MATPPVMVSIKCLSPAAEFARIMGSSLVSKRIGGLAGTSAARGALFIAVSTRAASADSPDFRSTATASAARLWRNRNSPYSLPAFDAGDGEVGGEVARR